MRVVENYIRALRLRTKRDTRVVPAVHEVVVPTTRLDMGSITLVPKFPDRLSPATLYALHQAQTAGLLQVRQITTVEEFAEAGKVLGIEHESFLNTMTQSSQLLFISEWVGDNVPDFLQRIKEVETHKQVGAYLAETLRALHDANVIAGDTHLRQFVVKDDASNVERIDLNNVYTTWQAAGGHDNKQIEALSLYHELGQL